MLDLDHFKSINDLYGHAAGDQVLKSFADTMRRQLRQTDLAGRLGGEEFAILLPQTELEAASIFADRLRQGFAALSQQAGGSVFRVTASVGCAALSAADELVDVALARADQALYRAKENGRDRIEVTW
jgi:diguanylate cyclase (GGDEF)-like protein